MAQVSAGGVPAGPGAPRRRVPRWALAVLAWVAVVALATTVAWLAISRAGEAVLDAAVAPLPTTADAAPAPLPPTTTPAVDPARPDPAATTAADPAPVAVQGSTTVPAGQVSVSCPGPGALPVLGAAIPQAGWTVQTSVHDVAELRVEFVSEDGRSRVRVTCGADGAPLFGAAEGEDD